MGAASKVFERFREMYGTVKCFEIQEKLFGRSIDFFKDEDAEWWYENGGLDKCPGVCAVAARLAAEELFRLRGPSSSGKVRYLTGVPTPPQ